MTTPSNAVWRIRPHRAKHPRCPCGGDHDSDSNYDWMCPGPPGMKAAPLVRCLTLRDAEQLRPFVEGANHLPDLNRRFP